MEQNNVLMWGSLTRLMDMIGDEEIRIGRWDELIDMIADAFDDASKCDDQIEMFTLWYQFLFRLYYRVRVMDEPAEFNQVKRDSRLIGHDNVPMYRVINYDYRMFNWAKKKGDTCISSMTNDWFLVREDELTPAEKRNFERQLD